MRKNNDDSHRSILVMHHPCSFAPMRLELVDFSHGKWHFVKRKTGDMLDENKKLK